MVGRGKLCDGLVTFFSNGGRDVVRDTSYCWRF